MNSCKIPLILLRTLFLGFLSHAAHAQLAGPPVRDLVDANGVDLLTGTMTASYQGVSIGPPGGGLAFWRTYRKMSHWDSYIGQITGSGIDRTVSIGSRSERFVLAGGVYTPVERLGSTLTVTGTGSSAIWTYTTRTGSVVTFVPRIADYQYPGQGASDLQALLQSMIFPSGERIDLNYHFETICVVFGGSGCTTWKTARRLASVVSNLGYKLTIEYGANSNPFAVDPNAYILPVSVSVMNLADGTTLGPQQMQLIGSTEYRLTDILNRTTIFTRSITDGTTSIRRAGSGVDNITIGYSSGKVSTVNNDGYVTNYSYSSTPTIATTTVTRSDGAQRVLTFDVLQQQLLSSRDELNRTTSYQYDSFARLRRVTAPEGNFVEYTYDDRGNVTQVLARAKPGSALADLVTTAGFDATCSNPKTCNQPNWTRDAKGNQTDYTYDPNHGGVLTVTGPTPTAGGVRPQTRYGYMALEAWYRNASGVLAPSGSPIYRLTRISTCNTAASCTGTADEVRTIVGYGADGAANNLLPRTITATDGAGTAGVTVTMTYDSVGNLVSVDGPLTGTGDTSTTKYDALRRVVGTIAPDPDGPGVKRPAAIRVSYDIQSRPIAIEEGTVSSASAPDWATFTPVRVVGIAYNSAGQRTKTTVSAGGSTHALQQFSYDSIGRLDCTVTRMNPSAFVSPPQACVLSSQGMYGRDRITKIAYDVANQVVGLTSGFGTNDAIAEGVTYTVNGQVRTVMDANGNLTTYEYDGFDRTSRTLFPSKTTPGASSAADYEEVSAFDANSNATTLRLRNGATVNLTYDALDRVIAEDLPESGADIYFSYDNQGRLLSARRGSASGSGIIRSYDAIGLSSTVSTFGRTASRTYNVALNRLQLTHPDGFNVYYNLDVAGQLTSIVDSTGTTLASYAYDDLGQRVNLSFGNGASTSAAFDGLGRVQTLTHQLAGTIYDGVTTFSYTPASQLHQRSQTNDLVYTWTPPASSSAGSSVNGLNQFTSVGTQAISHDDLGNTTADGTSAYSYNSENQLVSVSGSSNVVLQYDPLGMLHRLTSSSANTQFLYDAGDLIAEYSSDGTVLRRYVHGPSVDEPLVWYEGSTYGSTNRRYLQADERGSVVVVSDNAGNGLASYTYSPDGVANTLTGSRFKYTGQIALPEIGLYYYKARMYSPALGRFLQPDPIGYGDGLNRYAYVGADPINATDPSGLASPDDPLGPQPDPGNNWDFMHPLLLMTGLRGSTFTDSGLKFHYDYAIRSAQAGGAPVMGYCHPMPCRRAAAGSTVGETGQQPYLSPNMGCILIGECVRPRDLSTGQITVETVGLGAFVAVLVLAPEVLGIVGSAAARGAAVLDTNAIIAAVERGEAASVLAGRTPLVPITAVKEFLAGGGSIQALRSFLTSNGGRVALAGQEATAAGLRAQAAATGRVLGAADSRVAAGALREGAPVVTNDARFSRFLRAIGIPVGGF